METYAAVAAMIAVLCLAAYAAVRFSSSRARKEQIIEERNRRDAIRAMPAAGCRVIISAPCEVMEVVTDKDGRVPDVYLGERRSVAEARKTD